MTECAIVTGVAGQDGLYMAERLLALGQRVVGTTRDIATAAAGLPEPLRRGITLVRWDGTDQEGINEILAQHRPSTLYNLAALSSGAAMFDDPLAIAEINGLAVARILEAIRKVDPGIRLCQASSSEMFGEPIASPQDEGTAFSPRSPYGAAKLYAHSMVKLYRRRYGLFACSAILFNHESPRRRLDFVSRKISHGAARIKLGLAKQLVLGRLDSRRDWGFAGDYVEAMRLMTLAGSADDYVIATGISHSVRDLCDCAFGHLGLDYRDFVVEDLSGSRPEEPIQLLGNPRKARELLGWKLRATFAEMVRAMVDADLQLLAEPAADFEEDEGDVS